MMIVDIFRFHSYFDIIIDETVPAEHVVRDVHVRRNVFHLTPTYTIQLQL